MERAGCWRHRAENTTWTFWKASYSKGLEADWVKFMRGTSDAFQAPFEIATDLWCRLWSVNTKTSLGYSTGRDLDPHSYLSTHPRTVDLLERVLAKCARYSGAWLPL